MRHHRKRRHVLARQLEEVRPQLGPLQRCARQRGRRILDADDVAELVEPLHRVDRHVDDRARRDVVDDDRDADRIVHRLEVLVHPLLRGLVVVRRDDKHAVGADLLGVAGELKRLQRVVGTRAGDHLGASSRLRDADLDDAAVLVVRQGRPRARRADRHEAVRALLDLPLDERAERVLVEGAGLERRHQRRDRAGEPCLRAHQNPSQ